MKIPILIFALFFTLPVFGQQKMSERELDGLRGKVKSVTTVRDIVESKNYADNTLEKLRDKIELYDESSVPTEAIDNEYNYRDVYSFIDGDLTSKSFQIVKKDTLNTVSVSRSTKSKEEKTKDERYNLKYKYKFDGKGQVVEKGLYLNNDDLFNKIVYKYAKNGSLTEELRYSDGTDLNEQYLYEYGANGNLIEKKLVLHRPNRNSITTFKYSDYKTDSQGNWTERAESGSSEYEGKELKRVIKYFRKIEYYK